MYVWEMFASENQKKIKTIMSKSRYKWQLKYLQGVKEMPNEELLYEYVSTCIEDGSDGFKKRRNDWKKVKVERELCQRLMECGFLSPSNKEKQ